MTASAAGPGAASDLAARLLEGENRKLQALAAQGLLPLPPAELLTVQVQLAEAGDAQLRADAERSVAAMDPKLAADLVADGLALDVLSYLAEHLRHPLVLEAILRRRDAPPELLARLATSLEPALQEVLLLRQDVIVDEPEVLEALESNPALSAYSRRRIGEYREHLLPRRRTVPATAAELAAEAERLSDSEVAEALDAAREEPAEGESDDSTGLSESQIRNLPVPVRLKLTRGAKRSLRGILIRDPNPMVATSVLHNNAMGDSELEQIANHRAVAAEVLETLGSNRSFTRKYTVALALARNPRTPVAVAMRLLPRLSVRDLKGLGRDRNVANAIRSAAQRMYKMKQT